MNYRYNTYTHMQ